MLRDAYLVSKLEFVFAIYKAYIEFQNNRQRYDINKDCEDVFCKLLNEIYGYNLENANVKLHGNFPAVDLIDENQKGFFQVTTDSSLRKIKETVEKFRKHFSQHSDEEIRVLILGDKVKNQKGLPENVIVMDFKDIINDINEKSDNEITIKILDLLVDQLNIKNVLGDNFFESIEDLEIKPADNYKSYIKFAFGNDKDKKYAEDVKKAFNTFLEKLKELTLEEREFICNSIINARAKKHEKGWFDDYICIDLNQMFMRYHDKDKAKRILRSLIERNIIYYQDTYDNDYYINQNYIGEYRFATGLKFDPLRELVEYIFEEKSESEHIKLLRKSIVDLDFTILD